MFARLQQSETSAKKSREQLKSWKKEGNLIELQLFLVFIRLVVF